MEPLLYKVSPQHDRQPYRLPSLARLRIVRSYQGFQRRPWNHLLHLVQKQLPPTLPPVLLKHTLTRQTLLLHRNLLAAIRLINQASDAELVQTLPRSSYVPTYRSDLTAAGRYSFVIREL